MDTPARFATSTRFDIRCADPTLNSCQASAAPLLCLPKFPLILFALPGSWQDGPRNASSFFENFHFVVEIGVAVTLTFPRLEMLWPAMVPRKARQRLFPRILNKTAPQPTFVHETRCYRRVTAMPTRYCSMPAILLLASLAFVSYKVQPHRVPAVWLRYQLFLISVSSAKPPLGSRVALKATRGET